LHSSLAVLENGQYHNLWLYFIIAVLQSNCSLDNVVVFQSKNSLDNMAVLHWLLFDYKVLPYCPDLFDCEVLPYCPDCCLTINHCHIVLTVVWLWSTAILSWLLFDWSTAILSWLLFDYKVLPYWSDLFDYKVLPYWHDCCLTIKYCHIVLTAVWLSDVCSSDLSQTAVSTIWQYFIVKQQSCQYGSTL
jgi:hypothetical protein